MAAITNYQKCGKCSGLKQHELLSVFAHACNSSTLGARGGRITSAQEFKTSLGNIARPCLKKKGNANQAWWCMPIVPAPQEAEVGGLLEPGRWRLR